MLAHLLDDVNALGLADYRVGSCVVFGDTTWYRDYRIHHITTMTEHHPSGLPAQQVSLSGSAVLALSLYNISESLG
jgi:hypothetical protein